MKYTLEDDLESLAEMGLGPEVIKDWGETGMPIGVLATFRGLCLSK
jgi:hypothetical protein